MARDDELEDVESQLLPKREVMSLLSPDPHLGAIPDLGTTPTPAPAPDAAGTAGHATDAVPAGTIPHGDGPNDGGTVSDAPRDETITNADSASAGP
jgi:hypothetical protein